LVQTVRHSVDAAVGKSDQPDFTAATLLVDETKEFKIQGSFEPVLRLHIRGSSARCSED
jgi:hypothetical protein